MHEVVAKHVFALIHNKGTSGSTYSRHMKDARVTLPSPDLLAKVVNMLWKVPMDDRDTKSDLDEHMLGRIAAAGQNEQFLMPIHINKQMVELTTPSPNDVIYDPAGASTITILVIT